MPAVSSSKTYSGKREPLFRSYSKFESSNAVANMNFSKRSGPKLYQTMYDKLYTPTQRTTNRIMKYKQKRRLNEVERSTNLEQREKYRQLIELYCKNTLEETEKLPSFKTPNDRENKGKPIPTIVIPETPIIIKKVKQPIASVSNKKLLGSIQRRSMIGSSSINVASAKPTSHHVPNKENLSEDIKKEVKSSAPHPSTGTRPDSHPTSTPSSFQTPTSRRIKSPDWFSPPSPYLCNTFVDDLVNTYGRRNRERKRKIKEEETRARLLKEKQDMKDELLSQLLEERLKVKSAPEVDVIPDLTAEMDRAVDDALVPHPGHQVLCERFNISITRQHLSTLSGLNWLNDEVINFYMELIVDRSKNENSLPSVHAMNTFFYPKLSSQGYKSVRRWTKRVDIFSKKLIFFPIHLGVHWTLAMVDFEAKEIVYLDSMGGSNSRCLEAIKNYLVSESDDKRKTVFDVSGWKMINKMENDIPQQLNGSDCGVFACTFAEFLSRKAALSFNQSDMPLIRRTMVWEIINASLTR